MAEYGRVFGMEVIAWSQNLTEDTAAAVGARRVEKSALFEQSDVVSIHLVLSDRTRGLVGETELALMKPAAFLINTSRGPIVDERALIAALQAGRIAGAGLDVFDIETAPVRPSVAAAAECDIVASPRLRHPGNAGPPSMPTPVEAVLAWLDGTPIRIANPEALG